MITDTFISKSSNNVFAAGTLYRASEARINEEQLLALQQSQAALFVPVWQNKSLMQTASPVAPAFLTRAAAEPLLAPDTTFIFLGMLQEVPYFAFAVAAVNLADVPLPAETEFKDLREIGALVTKDEGSILAYARALLHWHHTHRFCGRCGHKTSPAEAGHVLQCTNVECGLKHFPRTDAAIIVLITHGEQCLLVRQPIWPEGMYAIVAGFLEPGESMEDAVAREVQEEVGLQLTNIAYQSSQPWPFPASIMVGFTAKATHKNFQVDQVEIEKACWLTRQELTQRLQEKSIKLPPPLSIAYRLISEWFNGESPVPLATLLEKQM